MHENSEPVKSHLLTRGQGSPRSQARFCSLCRVFQVLGQEQALAEPCKNATESGSALSLWYFTFLSVAAPSLSCPRLFQFPLSGIKPKEGSAGNFPPL